MPLPTQSLQRGTGAIGDATSFFNGELQALFQLRQGGHIREQSGAHRPELRIIDLSAQTTCCSQGVGDCEQLLTGGNTSLAATQQNQIKISHPLEAEASIQKAIQACHLLRFRLKDEAFRKRLRQ